MDNESPEIQTRAEHSRSLEDAEKFRAIEKLKEVGYLIPIEGLEMFHGRAGKHDEEIWKVDPHFDNSSNTTGNANINSRSTLYAGPKDVAEEIALKRREEKIYPTLVREAQEIMQKYTDAERKEWIDRVNRQRQEFAAGQRAKGYNVPDPKIITPNELANSIFERDERDRLIKILYENDRSSVGPSPYVTKAEVHKIVTTNPDATVVNINFKKDKLSPEEQKSVSEALTKIIIPITEGSPLDFSDRDESARFLAEVKKGEINYLSRNDAETLANSSGVKKELALQLASALNAQILASYQMNYLADNYLSTARDIVDLKFKGPEGEVYFPINMEYAQRFFRNANIVGTKSIVDSATLNKGIEVYSLFDLARVGTEDQVISLRREIADKTGPLKDKIPNFTEKKENQGREIIQALADLHIKPETLVILAGNVSGFENIFEGSTGTWEGFTLGEHTETVLTNFDENFSDQLPAEYLPLMRLAILVHDMGKPEAVANGEKSQQKKYNAQKALQFMNTIELDEKTKALVLSIIGDGATLAHNAQLKPSEDNTKVMNEFSSIVLKNLFDGVNPSESEINNLSEIFKIFQTCDGGAYTSMAITRRPKEGRHRNAPSFNNSFAKPINPGQRDIRYRKPDEESAPQKLTPKID